MRCSENYLDTLSRIKEYGLDGIELATCDPKDFDAGAFSEALKGTGQSVSMFGNLFWCSKYELSMLSTDPTKSQMAVDLFKKMIEIGAPHGIPAGLGGLRGSAIPDKPISYSTDMLIDILKDVANHAKAVGGMFCIEPQSRFGINMINTTDEGIRIIERVGSDHFKLTLDVQHMYIEEDIIAGLYKGRDYLYNLHILEGYNDLQEQFTKIHFPKVVKVLSSMNFDNWVSFTLPRTVSKDVSQFAHLEKCASFVKSLFDKYYI